MKVKQNSVSFPGMVTHPLEYQERNLQSLINKNKDTVYGRQFKFSSITNERQFREKVPLNHYADIEPYIMDIMEGKESILFHENVKAFFETSGTTSKPKYIPVTASFIKEKAMAMNVYWKHIYDQYPTLMKGKIVSNFSSATNFKRNKKGILIGSETDYWNLMTRGIKETQRWPIFYDVLKIKDITKRYYCIALLVLQENVAAFMSPNPSTLYILFKTIEENLSPLLEDICDGKINSKYLPENNVKTLIEEKLKPCPARAKQIEKDLIITKEKLILSKLWPGLKLYICWQSLMLKPYIDRVAIYLQDIDRWDHLYQASEGIIAIPDRSNRSGGILNIIGNYFEFIPYEDIENHQPKTYLLHELERGRVYEIVITNAAGLYRYRIGDVVKVTSFINNLPRIEFIGRTGKVCSMTGEKITEEQVSEAFESARSEVKMPIADYVMFPIDDDMPHYGLIIEVEDSHNLSLCKEFCKRFEKKLSVLNVEYLTKRRSKRLDALELFIIRKSGDRRRITDQTKPNRLSKEFNIHFQYKGILIDRVKCK